MHLFKKLRALTAFKKQRLDFFDTVEDHHLVGEIGYHQTRGMPLTLKQLFLLDVGSVATVQRRLRRLKELGLVQHRRSTRDLRAVELTLTPKCLRILAKYDALVSSGPQAGGSAQPSHVCGLCDGAAGGRTLLVKFLAQGLKRGDRCLLVASVETQRGILAELNHRRRAPARLVVSEGYPSADAQVAFVKGEAHEARQSGQDLCIAGNMSWTLSKKLQMEALLDIETQFDALAKQVPLTSVCLYDARHFSSGDFLRAVKCHSDHQLYPILYA
jgi:DNA-binding MarR family transcriptional regulator